VERVAVNPPPGLLGRVNAVVGGRARRYEAANVPGPLSVKCVIEGVATWETRAGRFEIGPAGWLVLNDGEEYTITINSLRPVETCCIFFQRGFVEDAQRSATSSSAQLLDAAPAVGPLEFAERLHADARVRDVVLRAHAHRDDAFALDAAVYAVAAELVRARGDVARRVAQLPALRGSTRTELARRLDRAAAFVHGNRRSAVGRGDGFGGVLVALSLSPALHRLLRPDAASLRDETAPRARRGAAARERSRGRRRRERVRLRQRRIVHHALHTAIRDRTGAFSQE
jgi:hypothetical protein